MNLQEWVLTVLGAGGGGAVVAYGIFQAFGKKMLDNYFEVRMANLKQEHQKEINRLKVEIDSMLSGALKLQGKEFDALPESWRLMDLAAKRVRGFTAILRSEAAFELMSEPQQQHVIDVCTLAEWQKDEIRKEPIPKERSTLYQKHMHYEALHNCRIETHKLRDHINANGIFYPVELRAKLLEAFQILHKSVTAKELAFPDDWKMMGEAWGMVSEKFEPLYTELEGIIQSRLQAHSRLNPTAVYPEPEKQA